MAEGHHIQERLSGATAGEQLAYRWLSEGLPPAYTVWHEPRIEGNKPDVVVFGARLGLAVLEVKDWSRDAIEGVSGGQVRVRTARGVEAKTHPVNQAEQHVYAIVDRLKKSEACVHRDAERQGRIAFPWAPGAVLPNMTRADVRETGLDAGHPAGSILTGEDIGSPAGWGLVGNDLVKRMGEVFRIRFEWRVRARMQEAVHASLWAETCVGPGYAGRARRSAHDPGAEASSQGVLPLDSRSPFSIEQKRVALQLAGGHQVLQGVVGSGKSEVVAARARLLADANPAWRILVLCYNLSLAAWLRARIFENGALQNHDVTVAHFHGWARDLLDRAGVGYARSVYNEDDGFPSLVRRAFDEGRITRRYDAILVDEGQDFTAAMCRTVLAALSDRSESVLFAMDNAQRIYQGTRTRLSSLGLQARGRQATLKVNHRCTAEINTFSRRFLWGDVPEGETVRVGNLGLFVPISSPRRGREAEVVQCDNLAEQAEWAAAQSQELLERGYLPDEIAVLYMHGRVGPDGRPAPSADGSSEDLVALVRAAFRVAGVPLFWLADTQTTKADAPLELGAVTLSTVHSFKGLEARAVILVGVDQPGDWLDEHLREKALLYVGMTRATDRLTLTWSNPQGVGASLQTTTTTV